MDGEEVGDMEELAELLSSINQDEGCGKNDIDEQKYREIIIELEFRKKQLHETRTVLSQLKSEQHLQREALEEVQRLNEDLNKKLKVMAQQVQSLENQIKNNETSNKSNLAKDFAEKVKEIAALKEQVKKELYNNGQLLQQNQDLQLKSDFSEACLKQFREEQVKIKSLMSKINCQAQSSYEDQIKRIKEAIKDFSKKYEILSQSVGKMAHLKKELGAIEKQLLYEKAKNNIYEQFMTDFEYFHPKNETEFLLEQWKSRVNKENDDYDIQQQIINNLIKKIQSKKEATSIYDNETANAINRRGADAETQIGPELVNQEPQSITLEVERPENIAADDIKIKCEDLTSIN